MEDPEVADIPAILPNEEKELKRVYDMLCDYEQKSRIQREIHTLTERKNAAVESKEKLRSERHVSNLP